jgi:RNA polymerase sigma-70 factor (ECF subfamily)
MFSRPAGSSRYVALGDSELALRGVRGDREAQAELVRRSGPTVQRLLRRMGAEPAVAEDLTQDALVAALRNMEDFRGDAAFASWVSAIAARLYIKRCRKEARYWLRADPDLEQPPAEADGAALGERMDLDRALTLLSPAERLCVSLCHGAGFTHVDLAASLDLPLGTVKSHVSRGLAKLRRYLRGEESPPARPER